MYKPKAYGQRVIGIRNRELQEKKFGSIILAPTAADIEMVDEIEVYQVGRGYVSQSGIIVPLEVKVGDKVLISKNTAFPLPKTGDATFDATKEYVVFQESDIVSGKEVVS